MSKWARVNLEEIGPVLEIITYDPVGVINEEFLPTFKSCGEEVEKGYFYNPNTDTFYLPDGYAKHPQFEIFGYVPISDGTEVDENGFVIFSSQPKSITEENFRSSLNFQEKILWDNPETGTNNQKAVINTIKTDFPYENMTEQVNALQQVGVIELTRVQEIIDFLA